MTECFLGFRTMLRQKYEFEATGKYFTASSLEITESAISSIATPVSMRNMLSFVIHSAHMVGHHFDLILFYVQGSQCCYFQGSQLQKQLEQSQSDSDSCHGSHYCQTDKTLNTPPTTNVQRKANKPTIKGPIL